MTRLEDLVREALATTPAATSVSDPVAIVERRVRRARRRIATCSAVVAVAVVAAVIVPLATGHASHRARVGVAHPPHVTSPGRSVVWNGDTEDVATGYDASGHPVVWAKLYTSRDNGLTNVIERLDPSSGKVLERIDVPAPASFVRIALGRVWVYGGGDGGYPDGAISRVDPRTKTVTTLRMGAGPGTPVFIGRSAYFTLGHNGELARIGGADGSMQVGRSIPGSAGAVFASPDGTVWVENDQGWTHLSVSGSRSQILGTSGGWHGSLLNPEQSGGTFWMTDSTPDSACRMRSVALTFTAKGVTAGYGPWITTVGVPEAVAGGDGGVYVTTGPRCRPSFESTVSYYSNSALQSANATPTVLPGGVDAYEPVADPAGGVLFIGDNTTLQYWNPNQP